MADESSNTASVAIIILVIAALVFLYFMFIRAGGGDDADIEIDLPGDSSMAPEIEARSPVGELYLA